MDLGPSRANKDDAAARVKDMSRVLRNLLRKCTNLRTLEIDAEIELYAKSEHQSEMMRSIIGDDTRVEYPHPAPPLPPGILPHLPKLCRLTVYSIPTDEAIMDAACHCPALEILEWNSGRLRHPLGRIHWGFSRQAMKTLQENCSNLKKLPSLMLERMQPRIQIFRPPFTQAQKRHFMFTNMLMMAECGSPVTIVPDDDAQMVDALTGYLEMLRDGWMNGNEYHSELVLTGGLSETEEIHLALMKNRGETVDDIAHSFEIAMPLLTEFAVNPGSFSGVLFVEAQIHARQFRAHWEEEKKITDEYGDITFTIGGSRHVRVKVVDNEKWS